MLLITKGYTRVSEVAARFTLDSLPGKQIAIDIECESGKITEEEAIAKRDALQREYDFYGAMEDASKFISGYKKSKLLCHSNQYYWRYCYWDIARWGNNL